MTQITKLPVESVEQPVGRWTRLDITVLSGGPSAEREVSLSSGCAVAQALSRLGHAVSLHDIGPDDLDALDVPADFVFVALHGEFGEDGAVQALLDKRSIPYCGTGAEASALAMNKAATKARMAEANIPTPRYEVIRSGSVDGVVGRWPLPVVVKPIASGSSVDTYICRDADTFVSSLGQVASQYGAALVEQCITGPELTVGVLGDKALPVCEIRTSREFYDYQAKYVDDDTEYLFELDLPAKLLERVQQLSLKACRVIGCLDIARVDWMVDGRTLDPYVLEINTIPGFTSHSLVPKAASRVGISFDQLCQQIVDLGMDRASPPPSAD